MHSWKAIFSCIVAYIYTPSDFGHKPLLHPFRRHFFTDGNPAEMAPGPARRETRTCQGLVHTFTKVLMMMMMIVEGGPWAGCRSL